MTAFIIVLSFFLFLTILLSCPVILKATFQDELMVKVRYLFITFQYPQPKETKKKKEKKIKEEQEEAKEDKKSKIKGIIEQKGLSGFLNLIKELMSIATNASLKLLHHLKINQLSAKVTIATEDAAQTALNYGYTCSVIFPAVSFIVANCKCKNYHVNVQPDFNSQNSTIDVSVKASIKLFYILSAAFAAAFHFVKILIREKQVIR